MKIRFLTAVALIPGLVGTGAQAQFNTNFQTITISAVTSNWVGNGTYVVGSNTFLDALIIQNSGVLSNGTGYIGYEPNASNNIAVVRGAGSVWSNRFDLYVGYEGAGNQLIITNGATVVSSNGHVGFANFLVNTNNTVMVTGAGSVWTNLFGLAVGAVSAGNQLTIANGGKVIDQGASVGDSPGAATNGAAIDNSVLVTDTNSVWINNGTVILNRNSPGAVLTVANGAQFAAVNVAIATSAGSDGNVVLVTDPGTIWTNTAQLTVGGFGSFNQFAVSNGATAFSTTAAIGGNVGMVSNAAVVTGPRSVWTVGFTITLGDSGTASSLTVTNGGLIVAQSELLAGSGGGGSLIIAGGTNLVSDQIKVGLNGGTGTVSVLGGALFVTNATATASVTVFTNSTLLLGAGVFKTDNLIVTNGGTVQYAQPYLVDNASLSVAGGNAQLNSNLTVGSTANTTGTVSLTAGSFTVTNASVNIGNNGTVGGTGGVAQVTVSGGLFQAVTVVVGDNFNSHSSFTVAGTGHVVIQGGLRINGNHTTTVTDSGTLEVLIGPPPLFEDPTLNNRIVVASGADGTMLVSNGTVDAPEMVIGLSAGNTGSLVMNGGVVSLSSNLLVGLNASATGVVMISGGTLTVTNGTFGIGSTGGVAQVTVSGGLVQAASILVGDNFGGPSSFAVAGTGHVVVQGGLRINGNHTTTLNGGTLDVLVGPPPAFEDPVLQNRIVVAYGADGTLLVSNGVVRTPALVVGLSAGNTGTMGLAGGSASIFSNMTVGFVGCASTGIVNVTGGSLYVTNGGTAVLEVRSGTFTLSAGTVIVDKLVITNACARLVHTGGTLVYNQLVLDPNLSAVGDGIPNSWKQQYGLDPFNPNLANADADGNGMSNLQEYLAGFNPTNTAAFLHVISIARTNTTDIKVIYLGANGDSSYVPGIASRTNVLEFTTGTANGGYSSNNFASTGQTNILSGGTGLGVVTNMVDFGGATNVPARYYRVRLVP